MLEGCIVVGGIVAGLILLALVVLAFWPPSNVPRGFFFRLRHVRSWTEEGFTWTVTRSQVGDLYLSDVRLRPKAPIQPVAVRFECTGPLVGGRAAFVDRQGELEELWSSFWTRKELAEVTTRYVVYDPGEEMQIVLTSRQPVEVLRVWRWF